MTSYQCTSDEGDKEDAYRVMLEDVSKELDKASLEFMKFQCQGRIGKGKLEKIQSYPELFAILEQRDVISTDNVDFLITSLNNISHRVSSAIVQNYINEWLAPERGTNKEQLTKLVQNETIVKKQVQATSALSATQEPSQPVTLQSDALPFAVDGFAYHNAVGDNEALNPFLFGLISFVSNQLTFNWQSTARHLGISDNIISAAQYNWPNDLRKQIFETFADYARGGGVVSKENLIEALSVTGRNDVAQELQHLPL